MEQCGFNAPWTELSGCYRMPPDLVPIVARFGGRYLKDGVYDPPIVPLDQPKGRDAAEPTIRRWTNLGASDGLGEALTAQVEQLLDIDGLAPADIVFLCEEHTSGLEAARLLEEKGIHVSHVFTANDGDERRRGARYARRRQKA